MRGPGITPAGKAINFSHPLGPTKKAKVGDPEAFVKLDGFHYVFHRYHLIPVSLPERRGPALVFRIFTIR